MGAPTGRRFQNTIENTFFNFFQYHFGIVMKLLKISTVLTVCRTKVAFYQKFSTTECEVRKTCDRAGSVMMLMMMQAPRLARP